MSNDNLDERIADMAAVVKELENGLGKISVAYLGQRILILEAQLRENDKRTVALEHRIEAAAQAFRVLQGKCKALEKRLVALQMRLDDGNDSKSTESGG